MTGGHVGQGVVMHLWTNKAMAVEERAPVEEYDGVFVFINFGGFDFACDDSAKHAS